MEQATGKTETEGQPCDGVLASTRPPLHISKANTGRAKSHAAMRTKDAATWRVSSSLHAAAAGLVLCLLRSSHSRVLFLCAPYSRCLCFFACSVSLLFYPFVRGPVSTARKLGKIRECNGRRERNTSKGKRERCHEPSKKETLSTRRPASPSLNSLSLQSRCAAPSSTAMRAVKPQVMPGATAPPCAIACRSRAPPRAAIFSR